MKFFQELNYLVKVQTSLSLFLAFIKNKKFHNSYLRRFFMGMSI